MVCELTEFLILDPNNMSILDIVPKFGASIDGYMPWVMTCTILMLCIVAQSWISWGIEKYHQDAQNGTNRAGQILMIRLGNAAWNDAIRDYCRRNGLMIVNGGNFVPDRRTTENTV